ncbi:precorrin-3B C(17)-methyltransferase [Desulfocurvibacter africanus]|uniref:precorrin-3B C(17)-methyltransferase n=1 Tax=Desulfocurvibacter africanus TaxID=873 RepID=UPI0004022897|nr:precorrin-3B C(17)-methyltransferase [Desulfocurvibacter africanus]
MARLTIMGLGPGEAALLAPMARQALESAHVVAGYGTYLDLLEPELLAGKEIIESGMMREMQRVQAAIDATRAGKDSVLVSSGDPGVYGMAGLAWELAEECGALADIELSVVPGIPALCAAAALLGAPLMHDFASVSLSDLLTPWEVIERRVELAAQADFVLAIYNPRSKRRDWQLPRALELIRRHRGPRTPVGHVRNGYRQNQLVDVIALDGMDGAYIERVDMLSLLIVGNNATRFVSAPGGRRMLTPRGYMDKYGKKC